MTSIAIESGIIPEMAMTLFKNQPVLDEPSVLWIFDLFRWGLQQFNAELFHRETQLVVPSNKTFPGSADSAHGKAELIFERVKHYAGVTHWPCQLVEPSSFNPGVPQQLRLQGLARLAPGAVGVLSYNALQAVTGFASVVSYRAAMRYTPQRAAPR